MNSELFGKGARALSIVWAFGVLREYSGLMYPHKAWLFHAHTVAAAGVVVASVWGTASSQQAARNKMRRAELLLSHRSSMQWAVGLSALTAGSMLWKKGANDGLGWLLLSGRMPSYHSWMALAWIGPVVLVLGLTGLIVHRQTESQHTNILKKSDENPSSQSRKPHPILVKLSDVLFGSLGKARKALAPWHRNSGLIGTTVLMATAAYGLTEKNDVSFRKNLAYLLALIWACLVGQKFSA